MLSGSLMAMEKQTVSETVIKKVITALSEKCGKDKKPSCARLEKGVRQVAGLWKKEDGTNAEFDAFCMKHFVHCEKEREIVFKKISRAIEALQGRFYQLLLELQEPLHLDGAPIHFIDQYIGGYAPYAHWEDDFYKNKIAFVVALNFPYYSLEEKKTLGPDWSRLQWAYARLGDQFNVRVPAQLLQDYGKIESDNDIYISGYNICMDHLLSKEGKKLFPAGMKLLSHWNLRDEIKSNYSKAKVGLEKQQIIYQVMKRIITQEIPGEVIDNNTLDWAPFANKVYKDGKEKSFKPEPNSRYQHILNVFHAQRAIDAHYPEAMNTYIKRTFNGNVEIAQPEVESLFIKFVSSPQVKKVAKLIRKRLKRKLHPFDIWYDGFKARSGIPEEKLDKMTRELYPDAEALNKDLPNILAKLGFDQKKALDIASKITVDDARGSGHAWGAQMKATLSHLRTRIPDDGMNYKGYNIAIHEFGHNVEQTISMHDVDYYPMNGVPNTAFTEALAFIFQARDLELLGMKETNPNKKYLKTLDDFWSMYEIMGVSLVEMNVWKWLYKNPDANAQQLKEALITEAKDVWNKYFAPVFGTKDQIILGIYSHMINSPLYLYNYANGYLIDFQVHQYIDGKDFAKEVQRIWSAGRLIPQQWMKNAVGEKIAIEPVLKAADNALKIIKK
ncbi:MAG: hypothetical protein GY757_27165 [bacterium]|nr:hypothetical protein [bacterium]